MFIKVRNSDNKVMETRATSAYPKEDGFTMYDKKIDCNAMDSYNGTNLVKAEVVAADTTKHDALMALDPGDSSGALKTIIEYLQEKA